MLMCCDGGVGSSGTSSSTPCGCGRLLACGVDGNSFVSEI